MTISDEVRAEHRKGIEFPHECGDCGEPWPCAAIRLADSHDGLLRAADEAVPIMLTAVVFLRREGRAILAKELHDASVAIANAKKESDD